MKNVLRAPVLQSGLVAVSLFGWAMACGTASKSVSNGSGGDDGQLGTSGSANRAGATGNLPSGAGAPGVGGTLATGGASGELGGAASVAGAPTGSAGTLAVAGGSSAGGSAPNTGGSTGGNTGGSGFYRMERLSRGLVAVSTGSGVYVGWRMFGFEYDATTPSKVSYDLYRDGAKVANVTDSTNYQDKDGKSGSMYSVRPVIDGVEGAVSETAKVLSQQYLTVPLQVPAGGSTPASCPTASEAYTYSANDASPGDADGDGVYEIFLKWDPSNAKDNSQAGCTGNVFMDAYKVDGTRLWRIDLGPNIRAGAHYTQFVVYDFDGDGKAEMAVKTAPGTKDGTGQYLHLGPAANDSDSMIYRNADGYILSGPEYLTVFNGQTGAEMATVDFDQARGTVSSWGDSYGNRVDRFLSSAAYLDATGLPSFIMARGYYTRATLGAWNFRDGKLTQLWKFDSNATPKDAAGHPYTGQGSHSMTIANVDDDPGQEIMYGAAAIDNTGAGLCSTGFNHGDAEHVGDLIPSRPGLEFFMCNEDGEHPAYHVRDAKTCAIIQQGPVNGADTGRCVADDVDASNPGAEMWASSTSGLFSATSNMNLGAAPGSQNFLVYWDEDETRELEDSNHIDKYAAGKTTRLLTASGVTSNNGTKSTPALTADLYGDWREEVVWRTTDSSALRIYTTTALTKRRIYTLMHDPQYRMQVTAEQTAYNQPPHPGFHIGSGMAAPPAPAITVK
ncbi:MAG TPA: rhamnogalacturonan lyase [Polyangiaceae bacterium]|nr:rhamnogalacturonan lyase [Polyangiaceae bacterium]